MVCVLSVLEVRPKPDCDQRSTTVPRPMRVRLRIAWNATCGSFGAGLHDQIAATPRGFDLVAGELRQVDERFRTLRLHTEAVDAVADEQRRAEPERDGERRGAEAKALAGVVGRRVGIGVVVTDG